VDTLLLADFAARFRPSAHRVVDLGAGVGALALAFTHLAKVGRCELVEREAELAALAKRNLAAAGVAGTVHVGDLAGDGLPGPLRASADVVLSNPPFFARSAAGRGDPARQSARAGPLEPFVRAAALAMGRRARSFFVYPASALPELLAAAQAVGLVPKRLRLVHAFSHSEARVALVDLRRAKPGGLVIDPPCVEWSAPRLRSPELEALVSGAPLRDPSRGEDG
jgi:tRNA1(Val) A37 N6-methylase TrmN6